MSPFVPPKDTVNNLPRRPPERKERSRQIGDIPRIGAPSPFWGLIGSAPGGGEASLITAALARRVRRSSWTSSDGAHRARTDNMAGNSTRTCGPFPSLRSSTRLIPSLTAKLNGRSFPKASPCPGCASQLSSPPETTPRALGPCLFQHL
jgi:hypothetical protein